MIFNLYIYDRKGKCLFYKEWTRPLNTLSDDPEEEKKLMFGMVYSLKELTSKIASSTGPEGLHTVKTNVSISLLFSFCLFLYLFLGIVDLSFFHFFVSQIGTELYSSSL
jgi:hypothetical protein